MKRLIGAFVEGRRASRERAAARQEAFLEREKVEAEHRREMELRHGWPPAPPAGNSASVMGCGSARSNGGGIAMAALFLSVAVVAVGLLWALVSGEPREWVAAYMELREYLRAGDFAWQSCFEPGGVGADSVRCSVFGSE